MTRRLAATLLAVVLASTACQGDRAAPQTIVVPDGYRGYVTVLYGVPEAGAETDPDGRRVLRVDEDGVAVTAHERGPGVLDDLYVSDRHGGRCMYEPTSEGRPRPYPPCDAGGVSGRPLVFSAAHTVAYFGTYGEAERLGGLYSGRPAEVARPDLDSLRARYDPRRGGALPAEWPPRPPRRGGTRAGRAANTPPRPPGLSLGLCGLGGAVF